MFLEPPGRGSCIWIRIPTDNSISLTAGRHRYIYSIPCWERERKREEHAREFISPATHQRQIMRLVTGAQPTLNRGPALELCGCNLPRPSFSTRVRVEAALIYPRTDPVSPPVKLHLVRDIRWFVRTSNSLYKNRESVPWGKREKERNRERKYWI